jgi:hypothetical protein
MNNNSDERHRIGLELEYTYRDNATMNARARKP